MSASARKFIKFCKFVGFDEEEQEMARRYIQRICNALEAVVDDIELTKLGNLGLQIRITRNTI